ncbi:MAG: nucleotidyltransferase domain-containing protein, partial [Thermodesulfobacteriota bacterium]
MKSKLRAQRRALEELWRQGLSGHALLARQSRLVDDYIIDHFADDPGVALVALGGYGRDELFPFSDVDLLILFAPEAEGRIGEVADRILYPLWDAGLEVGHGVRTVEQCMEHGAEEFFFQVALLDSRLICGDAALYGELSERFQSCFLEGGRVDFVTRLKELRNGRQGRFGSHSYLLEPQIKEGRGGMRDIQSMFWVGKVVFGLGGLDEMVSGGILLEEERRLFEESWNLLVKVRNRLHYISGRKNDQLFFEQQEEVAANFGYRKGKELLAVEGFMRDLYGHLRTIGATVDFFFEHVEEVLGVGLGLGAPENSVVEKGVELRGDRLHLTASPAELSAKPHLLMRLFLASARTGAPVHYRSRQKVSANIGLLTGKVCSSPRMGRPFVEILTRGKDVLAVLEVMLDCGMLSAYIPEYSKILSLAQHDLYHIYTVDRHLLQTVAELRRLEVEEEGIFTTLAEPGLLYLAALLHDLGKGSGRDHSV